MFQNFGQDGTIDGRAYLFRSNIRAKCHDVTHPALFSRPFSGMMIGPPQGDSEPAKLAGRLV
jgi:hypothetical protein